MRTLTQAAAIGNGVLPPDAGAGAGEGPTGARYSGLQPTTTCSRMATNRRVLDYFAALGLAALAVLLRAVLDPWLGASLPFTLLLFAVAAAAWLGGPGPALLAAAGGLLATQALFLPARAGGGPEALGPEIRFAVTAALLILLGSLARRRDRAMRAALAELRRSDAQRELVLDSLPMLVAHLDAGRRFLFANRSWTDWFGHPPHELVGRTLEEILPAGAAAALDPLLTRVMDQGETLRIEAELDFGPAGHRETAVACLPHRGDDAVQGVFLLVEDVAARKRSEHAHAYLAAVVESSSDAIVTKTLDGVVTSWNAGAERLFGHPAAEMVGGPISRIIPASLQGEEQRILAMIARGEPIRHYETERVHRNGQLLPVSLSVSPVRDATGRIIGASKVARDITERRRAEQALRESELRFRRLADSLPILIWSADSENHGTWFNRSWLEFTGRSLQQELGEGWLDVVHPDDRGPAFAACSAALAAREPFEMEFRMLRADGAWRWILDRGVPQFDANGVFAGYVGSCVDLTERKQAEERMAEADRRKDAFLATLAHELRNPLAPILNGVQALRVRLPDDATLQSVCRIVERQSQHMRTLVDDLLDLSRVSRGQIVLRRESCELSDAVAVALEASQAQFEAAGHRLTLHPSPVPLPVWADPTRLAQVFGNLLANAAKYTPPGGNVRVRLAAEDGQAVVRVQDDGCGIGADQLERIFEMFVQSENTRARSQGGLGIGLTLARQIVALHGGRISASSEGEGRGSEFTVRLPLQADAAQVAAAGSDAALEADATHAGAAGAAAEASVSGSPGPPRAG